MAKLAMDGKSCVYKTDKRNYRIYALEGDEKVVIFAEDEQDGGVVEEFVAWSYMSGFFHHADAFAGEVASIIDHYEHRTN